MTPSVHEIEILTPAFTAGADPRANKEVIEREGVRGPSIMAGLRWWFRAIAGGYLGSEQLAGIRLAESLIFGSAIPLAPQSARRCTPAGLGALASRVRVSAKPMEDAWSTDTFNPAADRELAYLAYGMQKDRDRPARCYLVPGSAFVVWARISPPRTAEEPQIDPALLESLLQLWVHLGGLGGRSRHGLGSMAFRNEPIETTESAGAAIASELEQARGQVLQFLKSIEALLVPAGPWDTKGTLPRFPVVRPGAFQVKVSRSSYFAASQAMHTIKRLWREHRVTDPGDPQSPSKNRNLFGEYLYKNTSSPAPARKMHFAGLGLPIPFQFKGDYANKGVAAPAGEGNRRASPIWFRVRRVMGSHGKPQFAIVALHWACQYLPAGVGVSLQGTANEWPVEIDTTESADWFRNVLAANDWSTIWPPAAQPRW